MGLKRKLGGLRRRVHQHGWLRRAIQLVLVVVIFFAGLGVGNGWIANNLPWSTKPVVTGLPNKLDYTTVNQVYQSLKENYDGQLTQTQLLAGLKHGLAQATNDPYTEYFTPAEAKQFNDQLNNSFSGIGAELGADSSGNLEVIAPVSGTPAAQAGLQAQDLIVGINGTSTTGMSVDTAVDKIRGPAGTKVTLQIVRNHTQALTLTITRQNITAPSVLTKTLPGNIGYMQITTFADDTTALAQKAADQFASQHVKGIVLDLRDDPGGLLDAAVSVSSLWLPQNQTVLQEKRGNVVQQTYYAQGGDELHGIPTVVLINGGSASASEITTGALHDNGDAYVIGQKSYGKGVVQQLINFGDGSQLKVTVASWYRPNGQNINHRGITPDKTVSEPSTATATNDPQLQAAETYLASH
ncbi:MAG TPA: S41 family peptidase [Verrucomicrobiae bacterium]|jgi:carboxyl-terminal processing protease|nr:S41 family peptidase [Verrucomicrobiae bacterium]